MEGKGVKCLIVCVLVLGFVLGQIQVEAKSCCPSSTARNVYNTCRFAGGSRPTCASVSGCKIVDGACQPPYVHITLHPEDFEESDARNFCKLGCTSSVCSKINTFVGSEEGNGAVDRCNVACYRLCTKEADTATVVV